jgi:hypothetical protein
MGGRGSCRAETTASSQWRIANGKWFFWRAVLLHCRKILGASGDAPSRILRRMNSTLIKSVINHWLKTVAWIEQLNNLLTTSLGTPHTLALMHSYTPARLHAYSSRLAQLPTSRLADKFWLVKASPFPIHSVPRPTPLVPIDCDLTWHYQRHLQNLQVGFGDDFNFL